MSSRWSDGLGKIACFRGEATLAVVTGTVAIAALWMTLQRDQGYSVLCARPADLYQLAEMPRISSYSFDSAGLLTVELENLDEERWLLMDGETVLQTIEGKSPVIPISPGISSAEIKGEATGRRLEFRTQWEASQGEPLVSHRSVRIGEASLYSIHDFVVSLDALPAEQVEAARRMVTPRALDQAAPVVERVAALAAQLHDDLDPHRGPPRPFMSRLTGFEQYQAAIAGRSEVYCANQAEIFAFMANAAGLPTRVLEVNGKLGDVSVGDHTFAET